MTCEERGTSWITCQGGLGNTRLQNKTKFKVFKIKIDQMNLQWKLVDFSPLRPRTASRDTDTGEEVDVRGGNGFED